MEQVSDIDLSLLAVFCNKNLGKKGFNSKSIDWDGLEDKLCMDVDTNISRWFYGYYGLLQPVGLNQAAATEHSYIQILFWGGLK